MDRKLRLVGMTGYLSTPDSAASFTAGSSFNARPPRSHSPWPLRSGGRGATRI